MGRRAPAGAVSDQLILAREHEIDIDDGCDFYGIAIEQRGPVGPLFHGSLRGGDQQRVTVDERDVADVAILGNDDVGI